MHGKSQIVSIMQRGDSAEMICHGCTRDLDLGEGYIQCMVASCGKLYHLLCINKTLTLAERDTWMCPECKIMFKKTGSNCGTPVGTPMTVKNVCIRNKTGTPILTSQGTQPFPASEAVSLASEIGAIRDQMSILSEQLADALTAVAKYHEALAACSSRLDTVNERLQQLELHSANVSRYVQSSAGSLFSDVTKLKPRRSRKAKKTTLVSKNEGEESTVVTVTDEAGDATLPILEDVGNSLERSSDLSTGEETDGAHPSRDLGKDRVHRKRFTSIRGRAGPEVTSLKAVEFLKFIHLWNMVSSADEIRAYLETMCPGGICTVLELKAKGSYKSYKIGVPNELYDKCLSADVWPRNARVKAWFFRRRPATTSQPQRIKSLDREGIDVGDLVPECKGIEHEARLLQAKPIDCRL